MHKRTRERSRTSSTEEIRIEDREGHNNEMMRNGTVGRNRISRTRFHNLDIDTREIFEMEVRNGRGKYGEAKTSKARWTRRKGSVVHKEGIRDLE